MQALIEKFWKNKLTSMFEEIVDFPVPSCPPTCGDHLTHYEQGQAVEGPAPPHTTLWNNVRIYICHESENDQKGAGGGIHVEGQRYLAKVCV